MTLSAHDLIKHAIEAVQQNHNLTETDIERLLREFGADEAQAGQVVTLMPIVFTRAILPTVNFADYFIVMREDKSEEYYSLDDNIFYKTALQVVHNWQAYGLSKDDVLRIAMYSAEFSALNKALNEGVDLQNAIMSPSILLQPAWTPDQDQIEPPEEALPKASKPKNPRWQFWKK